MKLEFDKTGNVILPRLVKGKYWAGPEWAGCCNSFRRPVILRCHITSRYLVGWESSVHALRPVVIRTVNNQRVFRTKGEELWAFKGRKAAVSHFSKLCREVLAFNDNVRRDKAADLEAARRGDIGAALRLGDY